MSITFQVDDVPLATEPKSTTEAVKIINSKTKSEVEACSDGQLLDGPNLNGFLSAVHTAYAEHRPLSLSPST